MARAAHGKNIWIAGGGALATAFAEAGLLDQVFLGVAPVMPADGKPLFTGRLSSGQLRLSNVEQRGQVVYLTYDVLPDSA
jgi:dihydrofolate reductase